MSSRFSKALRNFVAESGSYKRALSNCVIRVYSGAQPATPEAAPTGTLLCTYSLAAASITREVLAVGSVALTGGGSGSVNTLTVGGLEVMGSATNFDTSLIITATAIVTKINNNPRNALVVASNVGGTSATITLTALPGLGALGNQTVASTVTTITKTDTNTTGGVTAVNALNWGDSAAGVLVKDSGSWQGVAAADGTAGWFRIEAGVNDAGTLDSTESVIRADGAVSTSGAELNLSSTVFVSGATMTISSFSITLPTA